MEASSSDRERPSLHGTCMVWTGSCRPTDSIFLNCEMLHYTCKLFPEGIHLLVDFISFIQYGIEEYLGGHMDVLLESFVKSVLQLSHADAVARYVLIYSRTGNERFSVSSAYAPCGEPVCGSQMDNKRIQTLANTVGTLPRGRKQLALVRSSSLGDSSGPQRHIVAIFKEDKETFGFEIQTIRFPHQNDCSLEVCTCVCKIQEESPAHLSGLQIGDILANINGVNTDGFSHKQIVDLIKSSGNYLRLETVNGALFLRKMELETKLQLLKQTLQQKWVELRSLHLQEQRLLHGEVNDNVLLNALELEESNLFGSCNMPGPVFPSKPRFSSESSSKSRLSSMTVDSEDSFYQTSAFDDSAAESLSRQSSMDDDCFFPRDSDSTAGRSSLRRNRSISMASSGSMSPLWEGSSCPNNFGTLPRKSRRSSVRKHLLKFIPGLHRAVEEEESRV